MLFPLSPAAQDLEPRSYANLPVGQQFLGVGYAWSDGEINPAAGVPIEDAELTVKSSVAAYVRTLDLFGRAGKLDAAVLHTCFEGSANIDGQVVRGDRCGAGDPSVRLSYLFYGAPAMDMETFSRTPPGRVIGASVRVRAPLGQYNRENLINHGANRWEFKPELGISNRWGGRTEVDGERRNDKQENSRIGLTFAFPVTARHSLKFYVSRGVLTRIGNDNDTAGVLWQYRWGD